VPWRNRYLAPVYALIIGFVVVALLGAAVGDRSSPSSPPPGPGKIVFMATVGDITELKGVKVEVIADTNQSGRLDAQGTVPVTIPGVLFTVCAALPQNWATVQGKETKRGYCWGPLDPAVDVVKGTVTLSVFGKAGE
jgi:hypothetical protein